MTHKALLHLWLYNSYTHRRRIKTEEKAKVDASVWEGKLIKFLSELAVLHWTIWIRGWIAPGWFKIKGWIDPILQNRPRKNSYSAARNLRNSSPQTAEMTFVFSSVFILLLCQYYSTYTTFLSKDSQILDTNLLETVHVQPTVNLKL